MKPIRFAPVLGLVVLALAAGCQRRLHTSAAVRVGEVNYRLTGPHTYQNIAVYLVHAPEQDGRRFITLDEGLKEGKVKVTEKGQAQVSELLVENTCDDYLFLQEGDRIRGGKQDRTVQSSLVVAPRSGPAPLPAFCIEQSRWTEQVGGAVFSPTPNPALAPQAVRLAAKVSGNQAEVWNEVQSAKVTAAAQILTPNSNSSLNETLDAPAVRKLSEDYAAALKDVPARHPDAVGVAIAVNGKVEEVNIYPNHDLFKKLYPRLLQSYALQATLDKGGDARPARLADVAAFMTDQKEQARPSERAVDAYNHLHVRVQPDGRNVCDTAYAGAVVHKQFLPAARPSAAPVALVPAIQMPAQAPAPPR